MSRFTIEETPLNGLKLLLRKQIKDERGYFERMYCDTDLLDLMGKNKIVQINRSYTQLAGTIRGMHYQMDECAEIKIVSCIRGEVFDVAVDLRKDSPTFLQWFGITLKENEPFSIYIPKGFAHGFQSLKDGSELLYYVTSHYSSDKERGINPFDTRIGIRWKLPVADISNKDKNHEFIKETFEGV